MSSLPISLFGFLVVTFAYDALAQSITADPTSKALELFERRCSECHSEGDEVPELTKGTNVFELLRNEDYINQASPEKSELLGRVCLPADSKKRMPKSKGKPGEEDYREPLSKEDLATLTAFVAGKNSAPSAPPTDLKALAAKVQEFLNALCVACHSKDASERKKPPFMADLNDLRTSPAVKLDSPGNSLLYTVLTDGDMPRLTKLEKESGMAAAAPVSDEQAALILSWINAGAPNLDGIPLTADSPAVAKVNLPQQPTTRPIVTPVDEVADAVQDLGSVRAEDQAEARWISITPLHNHVATSEDQLANYRLGVRKMLNHLSTAPAIAKFVEVGRQRTLFRIRLRDLGWDAALWEKLTAHYPLHVATDASQGLRASTRTEVPIIRADWLAAEGMRPPLYHDLLRLPKTQQVLEHQLRVTVAENLQRGETLRYGLNPSGVSQANRLIERHLTGAYKGYYWLSYDFRRQDRNRVDDRQLLVKNPLGPSTFPAGGQPLLDGQLAFKHAGGEVVFSLPNGLHGYYVADVLGNRLDDAAPVDIVFDEAKITGRVEISNGLSCIRCHDQGIKPAAKSHDVIFAVMNGFSGEALDLLRRLHPGDAFVKQQLDADTTRYLTALKEANATPPGFNAAKLPDKDNPLGEEPCGALADWFDTALNLDKAAAELGLSRGDFSRLLEAHQSQAVFNSRIALVQKNSTIDRVDFITDFSDLIQRFHTGVRVRTAVAAIPVAGAAAKLARPRPVTVHLATDKQVYWEDDIPIITLDAAEDCHLRLLYQDARGDITILFPNQFITDDRVRAGKNQLLPRPNPIKLGDNVAIQIFGGDDGKTFGTERFIAIATDQPFTDNSELLAELRKTPFAETGTKDMELAYTRAARAISRSARVVSRSTGGDAPAPVADARSGFSIVTIKTESKN